MYCPKCGNENGDTAVFCPRCGKSLLLKPIQKKGFWRWLIKFDLVLLSAVLCIFYQIWAEYNNVLALSTVLLFSSYLPDIIAALYSLARTVRSGILRRRYISLPPGEREGKIADMLRKRQDTLADVYAESLLLSRLLTDTLFTELSDRDQELLRSSKAAMAFLRRVGVATDAKRWVITTNKMPNGPSRQACSFCAYECGNEDVYCPRCGKCFKTESDANVVDSFIGLVKHFCWD